MLNLNSLMLGSMKPKELADFYKKVLDKEPDMEDGGWYGFQAGGIFLTIGEHSEAEGKSKDPVRIILNFETTEVKEEFERIKAIEGAEVIKEPYEMGGGMIATIADPDGNYFQLVTPWEEK